MIRIEEIINDLLSFDQQPLSTWKGQVRWSTGSAERCSAFKASILIGIGPSRDGFKLAVANGQDLSVIATKVNPYYVRVRRNLFWPPGTACARYVSNSD
jgi:hypothetical protein